VLINDLLASGEIPDLFPDDEMENIISAMRPEVKGMGMYDSKENCWKFFISRVRRTLKARKYCPSPVCICSCCTVSIGRCWHRPRIGLYAAHGSLRSLDTGRLLTNRRSLAESVSSGSRLRTVMS